MRLLETHSHTSERPGYEARKNAKKVIEGNADTIRRQTIRQNLPRTASVAGRARRKRRYGKTNHRRNPPAYRRRGGGRETKKGELKYNTGAKTRETKVMTVPQAIIVAGGAQPTVPRGGEVPSRKRISKEKTKQRASQTKDDKTYSPVPLCECHITLAAPRLSAEEGVGKATKKKRTRKTYSPVPLFSGPITHTMAPYWVEGLTGRKKSKQLSKKGPPRAQR